MSNKFEEIDIRKRTYNLINIRRFYPNKINIHEKWCKTIVIYYVGWITVKNLRYGIIYAINPLYLITDKMNEYIEEKNGNKYLAIIPIDETKNILNKWRTMHQNKRVCEIKN